uniref:LRRNT domain-containing protein n=1 Tax=Meloidogyne floridensis TaxID=298350 RepID=A0A915NBF7_9BILA
MRRKRWSKNSENVQIKGEWCPDGCSCTTESPTTLDCSGLDLDIIPPTWPSHFEIIYIRNWTINSLEKQAFRRFQQLVEIYIFDCQRLDLIERNAFKQLRKLR